MNDSSEELKNLYKLNEKISNALNTIKIDSNSELLDMGNIPQILGEFFCAEYCAIGLCSDEKYFIDSRQWIRCENCSESQKSLRMSYLSDSEVTKIPIIGSLIGSILTFTSDKYNYKDNGYCGTYEFLESFLKFPMLNNEAYRKALPTGRKKDLMVLGLYSRGMDGNKTLIGYIQLINKLFPFKPENEIDGTGFIQEDLTKLKTIALSIELKLDNYLKNQELTDIAKDEAIVKKLINKDVNKPESVYDEILEYLTTEYPFRLASFWFPFWNGYEKTDIVRKRDNQKYLPKDIDQIKIVLRRVKVSKKIELGIGIDAEQLENNFSNNIKGQNLSDHTFGNFVQKNFIDYPEENNRYCVFDEDKKVWGIESECLKTDKAILVPIYRTNLDGYTEHDRNKAIHLMGILYLKYNTDDLVKNIGISKRLDLFAKNLSIVFEKIMFERRYKQIEKLKDSLFDITSHNINDFFIKIVKLVQENMHCGICSLFLTNTADDNLELVASTAEEFLVQKDREQKIFNFQKDHHDREGYQSLKAYSIGTAYKDNPYKSLTLPILEGYTCVNFDDSGNIYADFSDHIFYERTSKIKRHHSYLAVPLSKVEEKSVYGVIRCINKNDDNSVLYNSFTQSDKDYLIMIGGILSRFIELARFNLHKQQQYSIIVHDFNSPLSIISSNVNNIERRMSIIESLNNDIDSKLNESDSLIKNITQDSGNSLSLNKLEENLTKIHEDNLEIKRKLFAESKDIRNSRDTSIKVLLESQRELSVGINDSLKSMKDYLQDSDILGKNVIVNIKKFSAKETIQKITDYYRLQAYYDKKVDIVCKIDKMPNLLIDEKLFWRVIDNLVKNAVKYSLDYGGPIEVKFIGNELMKFEDSTKIYWEVIEISNFGIPINNPDKIFEYGYREENAKRRDQSGSGIGLAAVKQCMKLMNGDVVLYRQQRPVKFRLFFPETQTTKSH